MRIQSYIDSIVGDYVTDYYQKKDEKRVPSGKLSASILGWPLQWQILKYYHVPQGEKDDYTYRKFIRGEQVEEFIVSCIPNVIDRQVKCEYKDAIGFIDAVIQNGDEQVHEIKSVSNAKYRRINQTKEADIQHIYQACFYAMAKDKDKFYLDYVATDDYRVTTFEYETEEFKYRVEQIIKLYNDTVKAKYIPEFCPFLKWHEMEQYSPYPEFAKLKEPEIIDLLKVKYRIKI